MGFKVKDSFFSVKDTLCCGQIFRFSEENGIYQVISGDRLCYAKNENGFVFVDCLDADNEYFKNFFDLERDYSKIFNRAISSNYEILVKSATLGKGVRILNQDTIEMLFSFIVSQNNNIPRIKSIIEKLCRGLGEEKTFNDKVFYAFPSIEKMASAPLSFYKEIGLCYRAEYILELAKNISENGFDLEALKSLSTLELERELLKIKGVGKKVADCVLLFGFRRLDTFPVDTWIDKVYRENFMGKEIDRNKISDYFVKLFNEDSGYFQQYLFYYKRSLENK